MNYGSKGITCSEFVDIMRERGFKYDEENGGFLRPSGKKAGKFTRNGYRTLSLQRDNISYTFCEHRCVWVWFNGEIPDNLVINHIDFDRSNNRIENLEAVTPHENIQYTKNAGRLNPARGADHPKAAYTEREVQAMRYLRKNGWNTRKIADLFGEKYSTIISRITIGARYGNVPDAASVLSIYPVIVLHTINKSLTNEQLICNAMAGMCGELGEVEDVLKKNLFQGHNLDEDHLMEEIGDLLYYITLLLILMDYDMAEAMFNNMAKLYARYPEGFSTERSVNRQGGSE